MNFLFSLIIFLVAMESVFAQAPADKAGKKDQLPKKEERRKEDIKFTGAPGGRDPFGLPAVLIKLALSSLETQEEKVALPPVTIQGLILNKKMPQVIIDGDVKKVGDKIGKFEIQEIIKSGIVLFYKGKSYTLKIGDKN